jgi:hypothetical protein
VVQDTKWLSAGSVNRVRQRSGSAWQHQFWDRFVRQAKEFNDRLTYMHLNPVRKGLAAKPEDWRWSSCNNFALDKKEPTTQKACRIYPLGCRRLRNDGGEIRCTSEMSERLWDRESSRSLRRIPAEKLSCSSANLSRSE